MGWGKKKAQRDRLDRGRWLQEPSATRLSTLCLKGGVQSSDGKTEGEGGKNKRQYKTSQGGRNAAGKKPTWHGSRGKEMRGVELT